MLDEKERNVLSKEIMKNLLPTLRESNRYVIFEIISKKQLNVKEVKKSFEKEILGFLGMLEFAKSSFRLINFQKNRGIIKINRKYLSKIKAALALINNLDKEKVAVKSLYVSGMLKKAKSRLWLKEENKKNGNNAAPSHGLW